MAQTYKQISKQIAALQAEAEKLRQDELEDVVAKLKATIAEYELTAADLGLSVGRKPVPKRKAGATAAAKFGDNAGNTWGGRGPRPQWLREQLEAGQALEDFLL